VTKGVAPAAYFIPTITLQKELLLTSKLVFIVIVGKMTMKITVIFFLLDGSPMGHQ
jgi:hypothetical protein